MTTDERLKWILETDKPLIGNFSATEKVIKDEALLGKLCKYLDISEVCDDVDPVKYLQISLLEAERELAIENAEKRLDKLIGNRYG